MNIIINRYNISTDQIFHLYSGVVKLFQITFIWTNTKYPPNLLHLFKFNDIVGPIIVQFVSMKSNDLLRAFSPLTNLKILLNVLRKLFDLLCVTHHIRDYVLLRVSCCGLWHVR